MRSLPDFFLLAFLVGYGLCAAGTWIGLMFVACRLKGRQAPLWLLGAVLLLPCLLWGPLALIRGLMPQTETRKRGSDG